MPTSKTKFGPKLQIRFPFMKLVDDLNPYVVSCTICLSSLHIATRGRGIIEDHLKTAKHLKAAGVVKTSDDVKKLAKKPKIKGSLEGIQRIKTEDENFETCRLCLQQLEFRMSVKINKKIEQQFLKLIGIELKMSENYSKIICEVCNQKLKEFSEYQQKLYEIQKKLYQDHENLESNCDEDRKSEIFNEEDQNFDFNPLEHIKVEEIEVKVERVEDGFNEFSAQEFQIQNEKVPEVKEVKNFYKEVTRKEPTICPVCGKIVKKSSISDHIRNHEKRVNDNAFICDLCGYKCYHRKQQIRDHISKNHLEKILDEKFKCSFCPRSFYRAGLKKAHEKKVHSEFSCFCGKSFRKEDTLYHHRRSAHNLGSYKCPVEGCGQEFSAAQKLLNHKIKEHEPQRACEVCGEMVRSGKFYVEHMYKHDPPKKCPFEGCDKVLKRHAMRKHIPCCHGPDLRLKCSMCNAVFQNKIKLNMHVRRQHTAPKKPCLVDGCKYSTARKVYMAMHLKNHRDIDHELKNKLLQDLKSVKMA